MRDAHEKALEAKEMALADAAAAHRARFKAAQEAGLEAAIWHQEGLQQACAHVARAARWFASSILLCVCWRILPCLLDRVPA